MLRAICHDRETGWEEVTDLDRISDLIAERRLLWAEADIADVTTEDIATISEELDLHPLAVEDAIHMRQRPKLDLFENHLFVVVHQLDEEDGQLEAVQCALFIGSHYMLVLHEGADRTLDEARLRWNKRASEFTEDPYALMYVLLDTIVDDFERLAERLEEEMENLEDLTLETLDLPTRARMSSVTNKRIQRDLYSIKQRTARLRRYALPVRRVLDDIRSEPARSLVPDEIEELLVDVQDHVVRIGDQIRNIDELDDAVIELRRSEAGAALNEINKKLTAWAAILAAPTLISSVYGMNFDLFPLNGQRAGFWFALALIAVTSLTLYLYFKRKQWL
jgi:magnesium transporter